MKPRVFLGSSSEALPDLRSMRTALCSACDVVLWSDGVFRPGDYTAESLLRVLHGSHFAVFLFTPDDAATIRGQSSAVVRDNVLFELGLFMGHLGRQSCFAVTPRGHDGFRIATDLLGLTTVEFDPSATLSPDDRMSPVSREVKRWIDDRCRGGGASTSLTGPWSQTWKVDSDLFGTDNSSAAAILQIGSRVHARWEAGGRTYALVGDRIEALVTGQWYDLEAGGTYSGAFQFNVGPMQDRMDGRWLGFSRNRTIKTGGWAWLRLPPT
jgi:hypothetical protein